MSADPYAIPQSHRAIVERGTYVPSWYVEHTDLTVQVRDTNNGMLGFTVAQVLPERRWAIDATGKLMPDTKFEERYRDWISRAVTRDGRIVAVGATNKYFDVGLETVPGADDFVDAKLDSIRPGELRYVSIAYDPSQFLSRQKIRPIYNVRGEKVRADAEQPAPEEGFIPVDADEDTEELALARCGKEMRVSRINQHQSRCKECLHFAPGAPKPLNERGEPAEAEGEEAPAA